MNFRTDTLNRRRVIGLLGSAGAAAATGGLLHQPVSADAPRRLVATIYLQMLEEPVGGATVIGELSPGDYVSDYASVPEIVGELRHVIDRYGLAGWVLNVGLESEGDEIPGFPSARYLAHATDLRDAPVGNPLLWVPFGKLVMASPTVEGDWIFVRVQSDDLAYHVGWLPMAYLTPEGTQMMSVHNFDSPDGSAPMRVDPDTAADVIVSVPANSSVLDYDGEVINGFRGVQWEDYVGWISQDHLGRG